MRLFNLYGDEWDESRDCDGWRIKEAFVGHRLDAELIGASMAEIERGNKMWPYHNHANEEWVLVVRDKPTLRTPEGEQVLEEGDVVVFRRGKEGAHQIINRTETAVRVVMLSSMFSPDIVDARTSGPGARLLGGRRLVR
jgi:uncharacterized cupin superfamily protein